MITTRTWVVPTFTLPHDKVFRQSSSFHSSGGKTKTVTDNTTTYECILLCLLPQISIKVKSLLVVVTVILIIILRDVEVPELVRVVVRRHDAHPIPQVLLLEELLREVLQVALRELLRRLDVDLVPVARQLNAAAGLRELALLPVDLDAVEEELLLSNETKIATVQRRNISTLSRCFPKKNAHTHVKQLSAAPRGIARLPSRPRRRALNGSKTVPVARGRASTYKIRGVHDLVVAWCGAVDDELAADLGGLLRLLCIHESKRKH